MELGRFISIEGGEGAGKSTSVAFIKAYLQNQGIAVVSTREPGGTQLAEQLRQLLLNHHDEDIDPYTELLMMFAARRQHVTQVIEPALAAGKWVLCDRFTDCSYAYQGYGRKLPLDFIDQLALWIHGDTNPDLTLLLDLDIKVGMQRARQRNSLDRIESETMAFFEAARQGYLLRAQAEPQRFSIIDAAQDIAGVQKQLQEALQALLKGVA
ncbi:MAG: dTMP kinase [Gammaproteobacteria bacterium]|nr:dTMP kinase [Gammaproteobacteria bacterium]MDP6165372.1 dTMP kinase [Gammaproteobacteria bacterium]